MKDAIIEFYVNKHNAVENAEKLDLGFIPKILHRRMSKLDKITLSNLNNVYSNDVQYLVFVSQYGEVERLLKLIGQYTEDKEVSPNIFSGSVHNYSAGFFLLNKQKSIPYTSLSSCAASFSVGLLFSVISHYKNILFCYSDFNNDKIVSIALNITKNQTKQTSKYILKFNSDNLAVNDTFGNYIKLFAGEINSVKTSNFILERVNND